MAYPLGLTWLNPCCIGEMQRAGRSNLPGEEGRRERHLRPRLD